LLKFLTEEENKRYPTLVNDEKEARDLFDQLKKEKDEGMLYPRFPGSKVVVFRISVGMIMSDLFRCYHFRYTDDTKQWESSSCRCPKDSRECLLRCSAGLHEEDGALLAKGELEIENRVQKLQLMLMKNAKCRGQDNIPNAFGFLKLIDFMPRFV